MDMHRHQPPVDSWRYVVLLSKGGVTFLHHGMLKAMGVLVPSLVVQLRTTYSVIGLIVTLQYTISYIACPIAQRLSERYGIRPVAMNGGLLAALSLTCTSYCRSPVTMSLFLCLAGFGESMLQQTSPVIVKQYFGERFGWANTVTLLFSTVGSMGMVYVTSLLLEVYGERGTLLILGGLMGHFVVFGATYRSPSFEWSRIGIIGKPSEAVDSSALMLPRELDEGGRLLDGQVFLSADQNEDEPVPQSNSLKDTARRYFGLAIDGARKLFAVDALKRELRFSLFFLPCQLIHDFAFVGWCLFVVSFGISVGIDSNLAPLLAVAGAGGGFISRICLVVVLHFRPAWSLIFYSLNMLLFAVGLFLYSLASSFPYLVVVSCVSGFAMFGAMPAFFAAMSSIISDRSFPEILSFFFFLTGVFIPISGALTGYLYDVTDSLGTVFMIFGGLIILSVMLNLGYFAWKRREENAGS